MRVCLRAHRDPEARREMRAQVASQAPDWKEVGRLGEREGVAPLLFRVWQDEPFVPDALRRQLRRVYLATATAAKGSLPVKLELHSTLFDSPSHAGPPDLEAV